MKLIFAIVNNDDSQKVLSNLTKNSFQVTKLASTGGFLMAGNTTFMICCDDSKVDDVIKLISENSRKKKNLIPAYDSFGTGTYSSFPVEISSGGATIFVTNIERFEKV